MGTQNESYIQTVLIVPY